MQGRVLLLLSCSNNKQPGGKELPLNAQSFHSHLSSDIGKRLLETRRRIRKRLQGGPPRLYNEDQKGGYRDERRCNRGLVPGPDFGEDDSGKAIYLEAHERYTGRFFEALRRINPGFWKDLRSQPIEVLFVSGLYGLLSWDEPIQNYDCHWSDSTEEDRTRTVGRLWGEVLTEALRDFLNQKTREGHPIRRVYDFLSEESYQQSISWRGVAGCGAKVLHRIFRDSAGPKNLAAAAKVVGSPEVRFAERCDEFKRDCWYDIPGSEDKFGFELDLGADPRAWRERVTVRNLSESYPSFRGLSRNVLDALMLAENTWRYAQRLDGFDCAATIVSYTKVLECFYESTDLTGVAEDSGSRMVLGKLKELMRLRGRGAHWIAESQPINIENVRRARQLALEILEEALRNPPQARPQQIIRTSNSRRQ